MIQFYSCRIVSHIKLVPALQIPRGINSKKMKRSMEYNNYNYYQYTSSGHEAANYHFREYHTSTARFDSRHVRSQGFDRTLTEIRKWESATDCQKLKERQEGQFLDFTIMSYNVLAQQYLETMPYLYSKCYREDLEWPIRQQRLLDQFKESEADIVCLQEVEAEHYYETYLPFFKSQGYYGTFKQKTRKKVDGCATFFKRCKFSLKGEHSLEMRKNGKHILNRDNIALISILAPLKNPSKEICIVNTHLLYNPKREDVRLAQLQLLLAEIDHVAFRDATYLPVVFCGDLNLSPSSSLYSFLSQGRLKYEHLEQKKLTNNGSKIVGKTFLPKDLHISDSCQHLKALEKRNCIEKAVFSSGTLTHALAFKSVYNSDKFPKAHMASTYQNDWTLVDYILYSENGEELDEPEKRELTLLKRLRLPTDEDCKKLGPLPNSQNGSDHYHLEAKFRWHFNK
ncbi:protein angel homolog 2-like [Artemia franciscana]|uniref:protein angel homolog 2-like n=1 Tax=Artemia franciscana TaxID=6661 RepID=UPI0032DB3024